MQPIGFSEQLALLFSDVADQHHYRQLIVDLWQHLQARLHFPAVIGVTGAQGTGKTTLARLLTLYAKEQGVIAASVSLDDYYLDQQQRAALASSVHPLLMLRGMPGTHQIRQAIADVKAVLQGKVVSLPSFDKALDQPGPSVQMQQYALLIVEGWCLGVSPQHPEQLIQPLNQLEATADPTACWRTAVNQFLAGDYQQYWGLFSALIWLKAPDWPSICAWRAQQEQELWQQRGKGMTEQALQHFMQTFERLTTHSFSVLPAKVDMTLALDRHHRLTLESVMTEEDRDARSNSVCPTTCS